MGACLVLHPARRDGAQRVWRRVDSVWFRSKRPMVDGPRLRPRHCPTRSRQRPAGCEFRVLCTHTHLHTHAAYSPPTRHSIRFDLPPGPDPTVDSLCSSSKQTVEQRRFVPSSRSDAGVRVRASSRQDGSARAPRAVSIQDSDKTRVRTAGH